MSLLFILQGTKGSSPWSGQRRAQLTRVLTDVVRCRLRPNLTAAIVFVLLAAVFSGDELIAFSKWT